MQELGLLCERTCFSRSGNHAFATSVPWFSFPELEHTARTYSTYSGELEGLLVIFL